MKAIQLLSLLLLLSFPTKAQNAFIKEFRFEQKINITEGGIVSPDAGEIIRKLAEGNNKGPRSTSIKVIFDQQLTLNTREPGIVYTITSGNFQLNGDLYYKGFECSDELLPTEINYTLRLTARNGFSKDFSFTNKIVNGKPESSTTTYEDTTGRTYTYSLINITLYYRSQGRNIFIDRTKLINEYFSAIGKLDNGYTLLQTIDPGNIDNIAVMQSRLNETGTLLESIENRHFETTLNLSKNDPGRFMEKIGIYRSLQIAKQHEMNEVIRTLYITFYNRGLDFLRNGNTVRATEYFKRSLEANSGFAPALLQLAMLDYRNGNIFEATCKAEDVYYGMNADIQTKNQTLELLSDCYDGYLERGNIQLQKKNFQKAIEQFEGAKVICEKYKKIICTDELFNGFRTSRQGIYSWYLNKARNAAQGNDLTTATEFTEEALNYQRLYPGELPNNNEAKEVMRAIQQKLYTNTFNRAKNYTEQKRYQDALDEFNNADSIQSFYGFDQQVDYTAAVLAAARPRAQELLNEGNIEVTNNNLPKARQAYQNSLDLQKKFGFTGDQEISKQTESLRKNIYTQQCINAQSEMDQLYIEGQNKIIENKYLEANAALELAVDIKKQNSDCGLITDSIESLIFQIRPAVTYLELMQQSKQYEENGDYTQCLDFYNKASRYFIEKNVSTFGLSHEPDEYNYIRDSGSNGLLYSSAARYTENGELDKALVLYEILLSRNYDHRVLDGSLYKLGFKMGQRDGVGHKSREWKKMVKFYSNGDKNFKKFDKGYAKGFKSS